MVGSKQGFYCSQIQETQTNNHPQVLNKAEDNKERMTPEQDHCRVGRKAHGRYSNNPPELTSNVEGVVNLA